MGRRDLQDHPPPLPETFFNRKRGSVMGIKLFHKGRRNIHGHAINEAGEKVPFVFTPGTAVEFDDATGANIKRLYQGEVISMDDVQKQFDQSTAPKGEAAKTPHGSDIVDPAAEAAKLKAIDDAVAERTYKSLLAAGLTEEEARAAAFPESEGKEDGEGEKEKASLLDRLKGKNG